MPYRIPTIEELTSDALESLKARGFGDFTEPKPFVDPALQPGFRVKTGDELSGYTRELPDAESARLGREYTAAGGNDRNAFALSPLTQVPQLAHSTFDLFGSALEGIGEGITATAGAVVDPLAYMSGNGTPVGDYLLQNERLKSEMGRGGYSNFFSNVAKSATKVFSAAAAPGTAAVRAGAVALNMFAEPAAQSYRRAKEAGWQENAALAYGAAHGAVEAGTEFLLDKTPLGGLSKDAAKMFSRAVAGDLAKVAAGGLAAKLAQTARSAAGEGLEEVAAFVLGDWVDRAAANMTGDNRLQKQYGTTSEYLWDAAQSFALGAAAGGLISGGIQVVNWANTQEALRQIASGQGTPNAPQQPTPLADPTLPVQPTSPSGANPVDPGQVDPQIAPVQQPVEQQPQPSQFGEPGNMVGNPPQAEQPSQNQSQAPQTDLAPLPELPRQDQQEPDPTTLFDREMSSLDRANPDMSFTRSAVANLAPDVVAKVAAIETPSRKAFAEALGGNRGKLPEELNTDAKRAYAVEVAKRVVKVQEVQTARTNIEGFKAAIGELSKDASTGGLVPIRDLREKFPQMSKQQFDTAMLQASRLGAVSLHRDDNASNLSPQERDQLVADGDGNFYVGAAIRQNSAKFGKEELNVYGRGPVQPPANMETGPQDVNMAGRARSVAEKTRTTQDRVGVSAMPQTPPEADAVPRSISMDAPPVTDEFTNSPARVGNPTGATDVMAQSELPTGKVANVRMESNPDAERTSLVKMNDAMQSFVTTLTGSETPVGVGGIRKKGTQGVHDGASKSVRLKTWGDFPTLVHELTHSIYRFSDVARDKPSPEIEAELRGLGRRLYPDADPDKALSEGYSEAVRVMMQDGDNAIAELAPGFAAWFPERISEVSPKAREQFENVKGLANQWFRVMGAMERAKEQQRKTKGWLGSKIEALKAVKRGAADWIWSSKQIARDIDKTVGEFRNEVGLPQLPIEMSAVSAVDRHANVATGVVTTWMTKDQTDSSGRVIGPGMAKIIKPVADKQIQDKFWTLLYANRTIAVADPDNLAAVNVFRDFIGEEPLSPRDTGLSVSDARQILAELQSDPDWATLKEATDLFYKFNANTLQYLVSVAPEVYADQVRWILERDPGAWIPLRRDIDLNDKVFRKAGGRSGQPGSNSVTWKLRGSGLPIKSIFESVALETERRVANAHKNALVSRFMDLVLPDDTGDALETGLGQHMQVLEKPTKDTYQIVRNGKTYNVLMSDRLQRFFNTMNQADFDSANIVFSTAAAVFRATTSWVSMFRLALNLRYVLVNRPSMNLTDALFKVPAASGAKGAVGDLKIAERAVRKFFSYSVNAFVDAATGKMPSEEARMIMDVIERLGLEFNTGLRGSEMQATRLGRMVRATPVNDERTLVEHLDRGIDWLKASGRYASNIAESTFMADQMVAVDAWFQKNPDAKARWNQNKGLSQSEIASLRSFVLEVTGDAADDPLLAKHLQRAGGFLPGVGIRYTKSAIRLAQKNPIVFVKYGLALAIVSFLRELWKLNDDEDYRKWVKQDPQKATRYDLVKIGDRWVYVPVYSELGVVFNGIPRAMAMSLYMQDPTFAINAASSLFVNLLPGTEIPLPKMIQEQYTGLDNWGNPIVSPYSDKPKGYKEASSPRDRIAEEQYTDKTHSVAKFLAQLPGEVFGRERLDEITRALRRSKIGWVAGATIEALRSPMRVEHLLNFATGSQMTKYKEIASGERPLIDLGPQTEAAGTLARPGDEGSEFYARLDKLEKRYADKRQPLSESDQQELTLLKAARDAIGVQRRLKEKAENKEARKAIAGAISLTADTAIKDAKAGRFDTTPYRRARRVAEIGEAIHDGDTEEVQSKVFNGIDALSSAMPPRAAEGKTFAETKAAWQARRDEAMEVAKALPMKPDEVYAAYKARLDKERISLDLKARKRQAVAKALGVNP